MAELITGVQKMTTYDDLENDDLEHHDLENDDLENDDLEDDNLGNDNLGNEDLENDNLEINNLGNDVQQVKVKSQLTIFIAFLLLSVLILWWHQT